MQRRFSLIIQSMLFAGLFLGPVLPAAVRADPPPTKAQVGNILFVVPKGWKRVDKDKSVLILPSDLAPGEACVLILLPGEQAKGAFRDWFDKALKASLKDGDKVVAGGEVKAIRADEGFDTLNTFQAVEDKEGKRSYRFTLAAHPGDRFERLVYVANSPEVFKRYGPVLDQFIRDADFANVTGKAVPSGESASRSGNVLFQAPPEWKRIDKDQTVLFVPPDLKADEGYVLTILPGQALQGDFKAWFEAVCKKGLSAGQTVTQSIDVPAQSAPNGLETLARILIVEDKGGKRSYRLYIAFHPGDRAELIACLATGQDLLTRYQPALLEFLKNLRFANLETKAPVGDTPEPTGGIDVGSLKETATEPGGLYVGTESRQQFNFQTQLYDVIVRTIYYVFLPGGRVYYGLPAGNGLRHFDFKSAQRDNPRVAGRYTIQGDQIQFIWAEGQSITSAFERTPGRIRIGKNWLDRVTPAMDLRLEGTYAARSFVNLSGGAGVSSGGVSGERKIVFQKDGTFSQEGFVGFAGANDAVNAATSEQHSGSGTYRINGYTLELTYMDGRKERYPFFVFPEAEGKAHPGIISIDGRNYLLRE